MRTAIATLFCLFVLAVTCRAQSEAPDPRTLSITVSPIHLMLPVVELTGEFKVAPKTGMAVIAGLGSVSVTVLEGGATWRTTTHNLGVFELGASARYYAIGDFDHGMQLGAEILYAHVSGDFEEYDAEGVGRGLSVGPIVGYKIAFGFGLTLEAQVGASYTMASATASDASGQGGTVSNSGFGPNINLNLGWTM